MPKYKIYAGLGGGFGGADYQGVFEYANEDEAFDGAWGMAIEVYERYAGYHGLQSLEGIEEEFIEEGYDYTEDDIAIAYDEEMSSWLDFKVVEVPDDYKEDEDDY